MGLLRSSVTPITVYQILGHKDQGIGRVTEDVFRVFSHIEESLYFYVLRIRFERSCLFTEYPCYRYYHSFTKNELSVSSL